MNSNYIEPLFIKQFLSRQECNVILSVSNQKTFHPSGLGANNRTSDRFRKSKTCWIKQTDSIDIFLIYNKIIHFLQTNYKIIEDIQVVRYDKNDFFSPHYDQDVDANDLERFKSPRVCTLLIYLNDPIEYEGGETVFVNLKKKFKGHKGDAIFFYNLDESKRYIHPKSLHCSNKILSGTKYICNVWIRS
jgi:hypothetical protein